MIRQTKLIGTRRTEDRSLPCVGRREVQCFRRSLRRSERMKERWSHPMSKLKYALPALALLTLGGTASAENQRGWITALDPQKHVMTLDNGAQYQVAPIVDESKLVVG